MVECALYVGQLSLLMQSLDWYESRLTPREQKHADAYQALQARQHFSVTRVFLREILSAELNQIAQSIKLITLDTGKLALAPSYEKHIEFNVSHAGDYFLIAKSTSNKVGVDVAETKIQVDYHAIAQQFFAKEEQQALDLCDSEISSLFYKIWVAKEAIVKGIGAGLNYPLHGFNVLRCVLSWSDVNLAAIAVDNESWYCQTFSLKDHHYACLACSEPFVLKKHSLTEALFGSP